MFQQTLRDTEQGVTQYGRTALPSEDARFPHRICFPVFRKWLIFQLYRRTRTHVTSSGEISGLAGGSSVRRREAVGRSSCQRCAVSFGRIDGEPAVSARAIICFHGAGRDQRFHQRQQFRRFVPPRRPHDVRIHMVVSVDLAEPHPDHPLPWIFRMLFPRMYRNPFCRLTRDFELSDHRILQLDVCQESVPLHARHTGLCETDRREDVNRMHRVVTQGQSSPTRRSPSDERDSGCSPRQAGSEDRLHARRRPRVPTPCFPDRTG